MKFFRKLSIAVCMVGLGLLGAEGLVRVMVPVEIQYETWFTPGVHRYDARYGYVFAPGYAGWMRHAEGLWAGEWLELDRNGFREAAVEAGARQRIVCIGGRSLMMSYGLGDGEAVHARVAAHLSEPVEVRTTAWAGDSLERSWVLYLDKLAQEPADVAIVGIVNPWLGPFAKKTDYDRLPPASSASFIFRFMDGVVVWRGPLFEAYPRLSHGSYLGYSAYRAVDRWYVEWTGARGRQGEFGKLAGTVEEARGFARFLMHIRETLEAQGTRCVVVFLPRRGFPEDRFEVIQRELPAQLDWVDLNAEMTPQSRREDFFAGDHYTAAMSDRVGRRLAEVIEGLED